MASALDDEDLSLSINTASARRGSKDNRGPNGSGGPVQPPLGNRNIPPQVQRTTQRLGQYNIVKTLGEGSFGKVKLAIHQVSGQKVALKIISRRKLVTRDMAGRIEREIQYLQLLRHPHIIKLYTVITTPSEIIMVLEYAGGELFDYIVTNGKMAEDKARKFFQQIVCAVEYCHRHKIVHRDLKPENLLLDEQLNVKIADFGLSNIMTDGNFLKTSCGSPNYAAPEVISGKLYAGPEVDVWSCGVILYVLLVGRLPFDDEYIPALFKKIAQGQYMVPHYLSHGAKRLIQKMLQVNPVNRITVQEIRQDPWFTHDLADYLQPAVEEFMDTGVDPNKAIDPGTLAKGQPAVVREKLHQSVVGKLGKTMGYAPGDVQEALAKNEPSAIKDAYLIVRENQLMKTNPSLAQEQPHFMAQSPPAYHPTLPQSPRSSNVQPPQSPLTNKMDHPRHGSIGSSSIIEARSPASTVAILPSSLPDYHVAFMAGHKANKADSPVLATETDHPPGSEPPRTKEQQEATARSLKPHSRSSTQLYRHTEKPDTMTPIPPKEKKHKPTKWQFGIRSRNSPAEAMLAIYRALLKMGAQWEIPRPREPGGAGSGEGSPERQQHRQGSQSPEYSDSDPEGGTDPEYATHSEQERRRRRRANDGRSGSSDAEGLDPASRASKRGRGRERYGKWNDWGYALPEDPWVIAARFKKASMLPPGVQHPSSTHSSGVDLHSQSSPNPKDPNRRRSSAVSSGANSLTGSTAGSSENVAATGPSAANSVYSASGVIHPLRPNESVWVYVTIQLYSIEKDFYLVDFKCAGYERLAKRFAQHINGSGEADLARVDNFPDGDAGDETDDEKGDALLGLGRTDGGEKDVTSPFPFLDVASRLIIQLAEAD